MKQRSQTAMTSKSRARPRTLAIDIGGTGLKAAVLDPRGRLLTERVRVDTPKPCDPEKLLEALARLVAPLGEFERVSVGFPGLVRHGKIVTAPNLGTECFAGTDLAQILTRRLRHPTRVVNDADMQGLAACSGKGLEMVVTLGTGFGTALLLDGQLQAHLEIAHQPFKKGKTYDQLLGERARAKNKKRWRKHVLAAIDNMRALVGFDRLFIGGGNAARIDFELPSDVELVDNSAGVLGGIRLWEDEPSGPES
jgi:polyphosphate glucokinase